MVEAKRGPGRPPKFVRGADGEEIPGLRLHVTSGRYYDLDAEGRRVYFGKEIDKAREKHGRWQRVAKGRVARGGATEAGRGGTTQRRSKDAKARRKERFRQGVQDEILEASLRLFANKNFHLVSMREIAAAADVGTGTLYNYFKSKEDLFECLYSSIACRISARLLGLMAEGGDEVDFIKRFIADYYLAIQENATAVQVFVNQGLTIGSATNDHQPRVARLRKRIEPVLLAKIQSGIDAGVFSVPDARVPALALIPMIEGVAVYGILEGPLPSPQQTIRQLQDIFLSGLLHAK